MKPKPNKKKKKATEIKDAAVEALNDWLGDYLDVTRITLESDPQRLEALKIQSTGGGNFGIHSPAPAKVSGYC